MSTPAILPLLQLLVKQKGSDLHLAAGTPPMVRLQGDLVKVEGMNPSAADVEKMISEITNPAQKTAIANERTCDFAVKFAGLGVFRVNVFYQRNGLSAVFRALPEKVPTIDELKLPAVCRQACSFSNGLVLITGPTGSGKSTTLAAMLNFINENTRGHILTLEDPIEFMHESKKCMVSQRQLGTHFTDFGSALRAALREDPDVVLVGEMRDPETIALAITAAETGHLVFATLHTNTAAKAVDRIIDSFSAGEQAQIRAMLSESLRVVISQRLIPSIDRRSRIAIHDILVNTSAVANLIREGKTFQIPSVMQTSRKEGMQMVDQALLEAVRGGLVSGTDAWENAQDKSPFAQWAPRPGGLTQATGNLGFPANPTNTNVSATQSTNQGQPQVVSPFPKRNVS
jgi:twitching motility protein PilT